MIDIALFGAGGFGREIACMINKINSWNGPTWNLIGFFDDGKKIGEEVSHFGRILGGINELNNWNKPLNIALCLGNPETLSLVRNRIINPLISFPNLIDPNFECNDPETFFIGEGNIIQGGCAETTNVTIGNFNIFNGDITVGHDVVIGDYNVIMPGCKISGEVIIGDKNRLGAYCFIKQQLKIGNNITLSPLSALLTKPKDGHTYIGNPAKLFKF